MPLPFLVMPNSESESTLALCELRAYSFRDIVNYDGRCGVSVVHWCQGVKLKANMISSRTKERNEGGPTRSAKWNVRNQVPVRTRVESE